MRHRPLARRVCQIQDVRLPRFEPVHLAEVAAHPCDDLARVHGSSVLGRYDAAMGNRIRVKTWPNVECPDCGQPGGQPCVDVRSMRAGRYAPRAISKLHPGRIEANQRASGAFDPEDTGEL